MARVSEEISKANTVGQGKTDANLSQDSNHLGGIPADDYATKKYVQEYHDTKESSLKNYIDSQDQSMLNQANNNWLNLPVDIVINNILEFLSSLEVVSV